MIFTSPPAGFRHGLRVATLVFQLPDGRILLIRNPDEKGGCWSTPGGKCIPGEFALDGALREGYEEIGVRIEDTRALVRLTPAPLGLYVAYRNGLHFAFHSFLVRVPRPPPMVLNTKEVLAADWFRPDELSALPFIEDGVEFIERPEVMAELLPPRHALKTL